MNSALASLLSTALVSTTAAALTAADAAGTWVQILPAGTFSGIDGRGPWTSGDKASMQQIVDRTRAFHGNRQVVIDYDHQSVFSAKDGVGGRAPAAGWIEELQVRDAGIWAKVTWTEAAATAIKAGEYKYLSPVMLHTKAGKVLALRMAGLTNTPALDMQAVAASSLFSQTSNQGVPMDKIAAALGLAGGSGEDTVLSALNAVLTATTAMATAAGLKADAKPADIQTAVTNAFADRAKFAQAAGLKVDAKSDDIVTTVASAIAGAKPDPAKFVPIEQVTQLQADVKALKDGTAKDKAEEAVASAIKDGKLVPALKDWGLDYAKNDLGGFETFIGNSPVLTEPQMKTPKKGSGGDTATLDEAQLAACSALGLTAEAYLKTLAEEAKAEEGR